MFLIYTYFLEKAYGARRSEQDFRVATQMILSYFTYDTLGKFIKRFMLAFWRRKVANSCASLIWNKMCGF